MVTDVHQASVDAGAEVIITNNYSVVPKMLDKEALGHRFDELTIAVPRECERRRSAEGWRWQA